MFILRYIAFFLFCFNIQFAFAEVIFEPFDEQDDIEEVVYEPNITSPHPSQFRQILINSSDSFIGKLIVLGKYFDIRYEGEAIETDFSSDVELIFPDISKDDLLKRTNQIRTGVKLYRLLKEKINEIKAKLLTPKDPPLIVADDEYAIIGDRDYIQTKKDTYAVISDFKKVIGYSNNQREIEAAKARAERIYQAKKQKTNFEKFREMLTKIEFSKIPDYGVTLPNPFVGNAGVGSFVKQDDFKARLISSVARIGSSSDEILMALHIDVPSHHFILATDLSENKQKPSVIFTQKENISDVEIFYPTPIQIIDQKVVGAYRGNFAFPIKVKLIEKNKPLLLQADFTFESCDGEFDCQKITLKPEVFIEVDENGETPFSSMNNFIKQSFYNLPSNQDQHLKLTKSFVEQKENEPFLFYFEFDYSGPVKGFSFFLENEISTLFKTPKVIIDQKHIYIQTTTLNATDNILKIPLTVTARINNYTTIRKTITPNQFIENKHNTSILYLLILGVLTGFLFYFTPLGFSCFFNNFFIEHKKYLISKTITFIFCLSLIFVLFIYNKSLIYFNAQTNIFYLTFSLLYILVCVLNINTNHLILFQKGTIQALLTLFLLPVFHTFYMEDFLITFSFSNSYQCIILFTGLFIGLILPDILKTTVLNRYKTEQLKNLFLVLNLLMYILSVFSLLLMISLQITLWSIIKFFFILIIFLFSVFYIFNFQRAMYRIKFPEKWIKITENILNFLLIFFIFLGSYTTQAFTLQKQPQSDIFNKSQIEEKIKDGKNILIGIENEGCLICIYNKLTVFNSLQLSRWQGYHQLTYFPIKVNKLNIEERNYLKNFNRIYPPLYVFYNPLIPDGVLLPKILTPSNIDQVLDNFEL